MSSKNKEEENPQYQVELTEKERRELTHLHKKSREAKIKDRCRCILLRDKKYALEKIAEVLFCSVQWVKNIIKLYRSQGEKGLKTLNYHGDPGSLSAEEIATLKQHLRETFPQRAKELIPWLKETFHKVFTPSGVRKLLKRLGWKWKKPKSIPGKKPNPEAQINFLHDYWTVRSLKNSGVKVLFFDIMHLVHNPLLRACWLERGTTVEFPSNSGRSRLNVLGALDIDTMNLVYDADESACDHERLIKFLKKLEKTLSEKYETIVLIWDNASIHWHPKVTEYLHGSRITVMYLPSYSPNLNLIERFWKFCKKHLVVNSYIEKYYIFRARVFQLLNHLDEHIEELRSLITEEFQIVY